MLRIDLNCDLGEGFGAYHLGHDEAIIPCVSSVNVACGFHAGDPGVMRRTVELAAESGVAVGAHPGLPDLGGFGRREMAVSPREVEDMLIYQIGALWAFTRAAGVGLAHVKPHGALYNMAARDAALARAVAVAVHAVDPTLVLFALAGSKSVEAGRQMGLTVAEEAFADRGYLSSGALAPRGTAGALLDGVEEVASRAVAMALRKPVSTLDGSGVTLAADTICLHGDGPHAIEFARRVRGALEEAGVAVSAPVAARSAEAVE